MSNLDIPLPEWEQVCFDNYMQLLFEYNGTLQCDDYIITQNDPDSIEQCYKCHVKF